MSRLACRIQSFVNSRSLLRVTWSDGLESKFTNFWLRSSVRDPRFFESTSLLYRPEHLHFLNREANIEEVKICKETNSLKVCWSDHCSDFNIPWLRAQDLQALPKTSTELQVEHWDGSGEIPTYEYKERTEKIEQWMGDLRKWGLVYFHGVPRSEKGLKSIVNLIGPAKQRYHPTDVFSLQSGDRTSVAVELAYSPAFLAGHTDTIYYK